MSYSVRNVRNLYYAASKEENLYTVGEDGKKITVNPNDGSWNAYKDLEGCGYFECVENGHIVRTPKIERVTYVKVTPGSEMNSKIFTYTIKIDSTKIKANQTYTLSMVVPDFNGIDVGLENYVRGTYTAKTDGDTGVAQGIVDDIKKQKKAGTDDPNISTPFLWDIFIDIDGITVNGNYLTVSTKIDVPKEFEVGSWMPELQQRQLQFEFKPVYEDGVAEYYWGEVVGKPIVSPANDYKHKLDSMEWFYNGERGEMERVRTLRDPLPKAKLHNFAETTDDYSVLDIHYRVDGDGSIMGDVDITIIVNEGEESADTLETEMKKVLDALKTAGDSELELLKATDEEKEAKGEAYETAVRAYETAVKGYNDATKVYTTKKDNAKNILTALKIGTATENKTIETFGA